MKLRDLVGDVDLDTEIGLLVLNFGPQPKMKLVQTSAGLMIMAENAGIASCPGCKQPRATETRNHTEETRKELCLRCYNRQFDVKCNGCDCDMQVYGGAFVSKDVLSRICKKCEKRLAKAEMVWYDGLGRTVIEADRAVMISFLKGK